MEDRNKKAILILIAALIVMAIIAVIIWWQFFRQEPPPINNIANTSNANSQVVIINDAATNTMVSENTNSSQVDDELALTRLANLFIERLGSYSSEAEYQNLIDLKGFMTDKMQIWADDYIKIQQSKTPTSDFSAVTTKVITTQVVNLGGNLGTVQSTTQRIEYGADTNTESDPYYQEVVLEMIKQDGDWLVDQAEWQEKGVITTEPVSTNINTEASNTNSSNTNFNIDIINMYEASRGN